MKKQAAVLTALLLLGPGLLAQKGLDDIWRTAEANGIETQKIIRFCNRYAWGWLSQADPETGLLPRNLSGSWLWNAQDCAADNFPFLLLTGYVTGQNHLIHAGLRILRKERELMPRLRSLPDTYDFATGKFASDEINKDSILFGASEYVKDGLMPITEWLGAGPWLDLYKKLVIDIWSEAEFQTKAGTIPTNNVEVHGELLQSLSRLYWITGEDRFKIWAFRLADYYLLHNDLTSSKTIRLRDHGCEVLSGISEAYLIAAHEDRGRHDRYKEPLYRLLDNILAKGVNADGMMPDAYNPVTGEPISERLADTWGYVYNAFLTVRQVDGEGRYLKAVRHALDNVYKYLGQDWEGGSSDGYADAIEGALNLINRVKSPAAERWIDESLPYILAKQKEDGIIEGWYGDGNSARTALMAALWKTRGVTAVPWREDLLLGAAEEDGKLFISITAGRFFNGCLRLDQPRHSRDFHMPLDYPRINQFPQWFTADEKRDYLVTREGESTEKLSGKELLNLPIRLEKGETIRITVQPVPDASQASTSGAARADTSDGSANSFRRFGYARGTAEEARNWQVDLRKDLANLMKITDLTKRGLRYGFEARVLEEKEKERYIWREIEIRSTPGRRIKFVLTLPRQGGSHGAPAVVCLHGHGGNRLSTHDPEGPYRGFAAELARRGFVTIAPDVGQHEVYESGRTLMGERLWDCIRCLDYLESLAEVDPHRIGCGGLSLGGEMAMWLAAMDTRVKASVSAGFLTVMDQMERNHCLCWKFDGLRELVDFPDIYAMTAPRALQCQNGRLEPLSQFNITLARFAYEQILPAYLDFDRPENIELRIHEGGHVVDVPALVKFLSWQLGK